MIRINGAQTNKLARSKVLLELERRKYVVLSQSRPMRIKSPSGAEFDLGIHGLRNPNPWPKHNPNASHYVFVYMPLNERSPAQFWVITREQADQLHTAYHARYPANLDKTGGGFAWKDLEKLPSGRWINLPP